MLVVRQGSGVAQSTGGEDERGGSAAQDSRGAADTALGIDPGSSKKKKQKRKQRGGVGKEECAAVIADRGIRRPENHPADANSCNETELPWWEVTWRSLGPV